MPKNDALPPAAESRQRDLLEYLDSLGKNYAELGSEIAAAYDAGNCFGVFDRINRMLEADPTGSASVGVLAALRIAGDVLRILDTEAVRAAADALLEPGSDGLRVPILSVIGSLVSDGAPGRASRQLDSILAKANALSPVQDAALRRMRDLIRLRAS